MLVAVGQQFPRGRPLTGHGPVITSSGEAASPGVSDTGSTLRQPTLRMQPDTVSQPAVIKNNTKTLDHATMQRTLV